MKFKLRVDDVVVDGCWEDTNGIPRHRVLRFDTESNEILHDNKRFKDMILFDNNTKKYSISYNDVYRLVNSEYCNRYWVGVLNVGWFILEEVKQKSKKQFPNSWIFDIILVSTTNKEKSQ